MTLPICIHLRIHCLSGHSAGVHLAMWWWCSPDDLGAVRFLNIDCFWFYLHGSLAHVWPWYAPKPKRTVFLSDILATFWSALESKTGRNPFTDFVIFSYLKTIKKQEIIFEIFGILLYCLNYFRNFNVVSSFNRSSAYLLMWKKVHRAQWLLHSPEMTPWGVGVWSLQYSN